MFADMVDAMEFCFGISEQKLDGIIKPMLERYADDEFVGEIIQEAVDYLLDASSRLKSVGGLLNEAVEEMGMAEEIEKDNR